VYGGGKMIYNFYCITNLINNKKYIGLTKRDVDIRFNEHIKNALTEHDVKNDYFMPILNSIRKYGVENFKFDILESKEFETFVEAEGYEGDLIKQHNSFLEQHGYNLNYISEGKRIYIKSIREKKVFNSIGGNNPFYGKKHTQETKQRISEKAKERYSDPSKNPRYGYKFTDEEKLESRKRMSKHSKPFSVEGKEFMSLKQASDELKMSKQAIRFRLHSTSFEDWKYLTK
jgi:group I intron endonuclease